MTNKWMLRRTKVDLKNLSIQCGISETIAAVLVNRGIDKVEEINKFLNPALEDMYDPFLMKDMQVGTHILQDAIRNNKKIVVYGDYDADGVTSTVILYKCIKKCGGTVSYYIPDRETEGYGMSSERVKKLKEQGTEVIITCDNGISAIEQVKLAKDLGMQVVVTDHHELPFIEEVNGERTYILSEADAVINPKRQECTYPFKYLCGAGIAYKFSEALFKTFGYENTEANEYLQFAGIGTICDIVDLKDENRIIAKYALDKLNDTDNLGLSTLKEVLGLKDKKISTYNIGFQIGPCINATGRLDKASLSVELLLCEDKERALELSKQLDSLNRERQELTNKNVEETINIVEHSKMKEDKVLVIYKKDVHESIAGIVAGKIKDRYNVPTIVLTSGKDMPKGSARSIEEYNMFEELIKCKELLCKFGGHPMAAGLSLKEENINKLREKLNENCTLTNEDIIPKIRIDRTLNFNQINNEIIEELELLQPFGKGNSSPLFAVKNVRVLNSYVLGKDSKTLKLLLDFGDGRRNIQGICFGMVDRYNEIIAQNKESIIKIDLIYVPYINEYKGTKSVQVKIQDFRVSEN